MAGYPVIGGFDPHSLPPVQDELATNDPLVGSYTSKRQYGIAVGLYHLIDDPIPQMFIAVLRFSSTRHSMPDLLDNQSCKTKLPT
jgi:hypothetical protein